MPDVSHLEFTSGTYDIKDAVARDEITKILASKLTGGLVYRTYNEYINGITPDTSANPVWTFLQGITLTPSGTIIYSVTPQYSQLQSNKVLLCEVNLSTRTLIRTAILPLAHSNALAFNNETNEIYSACSSSYSGGTQVANNTIYVIDYSTFSIKRAITPPTEITATNRVRSVSYDNKNKVLAYGDKYDIWLMENENTVAKHIICDMSDTLSPYISDNFQTIKYWDGKVFISRTMPVGIAVFNENGDLIKNYFDIQATDSISIGELEDFELDNDGNLYFGSVQRTASEATNFWDITVFKSNIFKDGFNAHYNQTIKTSGSQVYVDINAKNNGSLQIGTKEHPFAHMQQAILYGNSVSSYAGIEVSCLSDGDYRFIAGNGTTYFRIQASGHNCKLHNMFLRSGRWYITGFNVDTTILVNEQSEKYKTNVAIGRQADVHLNNCVIGSSSVKQECGINIEGSKLYLDNCTINNFTNGIRLQGGAILNIYDEDITNCNYKYMCTVRACEINSQEDVLDNLNPAGVLPQSYGHAGDIHFGDNNGTVTVDPMPTSAQPFIAVFRIDLPGGTPTYLSVLCCPGGQAGFIDSANNTMYAVYANVTRTTTGFTYVIGVRSQALTGGTWTSVTSSSTITLTNVIVL